MSTSGGQPLHPRPSGRGITGIDKPKDWNKMIALEKKINYAVLEGDVTTLKKALVQYKGLIFSMNKKV